MLDGAKITYVGPSAGAPTAGPNDEVTEVPAVMPGMWDSHAHFFGLTLADVDQIATVDRVTAAARSVADAGATLDGGVTSVGELGGLGVELFA